jgi:protein involved in polysaccharide export with SLBB domain
MAPLGDVLAAGRTVQELDAAISQGLASVLPDPDVTVFVREFGNQNVYVGGEVERPGVIPFRIVASGNDTYVDGVVKRRLVSRP